MAYQTPKTDWQSYDVVSTVDLNRIEGNILELKKAATIDIQDDGENFTATNVEDALQELAGNVKNGKTAIANSIVAMGQSASGNDTFDALATKIRDISKDATAGTGDVLSGKTFYQGGSKKTGTMTNRGAVVITPGTVNQAILEGYHNGSGYVVGDPDLVAQNIKKNVSIFGVTGTLESIDLTIQSGTYYVSSGSAIDTVDIPISSIDISKSVPMVSWRTTVGLDASPDYAHHAVYRNYFTNSTTLTVNKYANYFATSSTDSYLCWQVIQFNAGVNVQQFYGTISDEVGTYDITISQVDPARTIIYNHRPISGTNNRMRKWLTTVELLNSTTIRLQRMESDTTANYSLHIMSFL